MNFFLKLALVPFVVTVVLLAALDGLVRDRRRRQMAASAQCLSAMREGMTFGVLGTAVVSLLVILYSDSLGMSARMLPWFAALPAVGGYLGAALGFHFGGRDPAKVDRG